MPNIGAATAQLAGCSLDRAPQRPGGAAPHFAPARHAGRRRPRRRIRPTTGSSRRSTSACSAWWRHCCATNCRPGARPARNRPRRSWCGVDERGAGGGRLRRLRRPARRGDRFHPCVRSPGSTLKPFLDAAALQRGLLHPADMLDDGPADRRDPQRRLALSRAAAAGPGTGQFPQRAGGRSAAASGHRRGLRPVPCTGAADAGRGAGQPRPGDGDRRPADQPGPARRCLHRAGG